mgnify:CR=1 FL=1
MLKKQFRLPAHIRLIRHQSFNSPLFLLKVSENNLKRNRFGFVVSKKTDKRATVRNKIRRLFRSCIEEMLSEIKTSYDMLFFLKLPILEIERKEMYNMIYAFFKDKNLLK